MNRLLIRIIILFSGVFLLFETGFSQDKDLEFNLDINSKTTNLLPIFYPSIDLSGRGYHPDVSWPYHLANKEVIWRWHSEIGFNKGFFRLYLNLWEIEATKYDPQLQKSILSNYEKIIKIISDSGGKVMLVLYGTPASWGRVLDKRSTPLDLKVWQNYIKRIIRYFSVEKKYNIWYEVWSSPDSEDFFLGTKRDYLNLYEVTCKAIKELENEAKINIPVGGPGVSSWFQNFERNTIISSERSLIYELIKFCSQKNLPLDFISWHAFSDDPLIEKEKTLYEKFPAQLIRDWLKYFHLDNSIPLIVSEWNYDAGSNWDLKRSEKSYMIAGFLLSRIKAMAEVGIDYQIYFCLEDFQDNKEGLNINRGLFSYSSGSFFSSNAKSLYNVFLFLNQLGDKSYGCFSLDEFVQILVTRKDGDIIILLWNYIDPYLGRNYLFRNISLLNEKDRRSIVNLFKTLKLEPLINAQIIPKEITLSDKLRTILKKANQLQQKADTFKDKKRYLKINLLNLKGSYLYQRYTINQQCSWDCVFLPIEEKMINVDGKYEENLEILPYSVELIILKKEITKN
jgi:hypothetical protein